MSGAWSWPSEPDPREPFGEPLPPGIDPDRARFAADVLAAEAGLVPPGPVLSEGERRGYLAPLAAAADGDGPLPDEIPSDADLVRIATEHDPAVVASAADRVLGPLADLADPVSRRIAVAWGALFPGDGWDTSPADRCLRTRRAPMRSGLQAVLRTPPGVWEITALSATTVEVVDRIGLAAPSGPVVLRPPAAALGAPRVGHGLLARLVRTPGGCEAVAPIVVPLVPAVIARWQVWATLYARAVHPGVRTLGDLLRARGHHLARRLLEAGWAEST